MPGRCRGVQVTPYVAGGSFLSQGVWKGARVGGRGLQRTQPCEYRVYISDRYGRLMAKSSIVSKERSSKVAGGLVTEQYGLPLNCVLRGHIIYLRCF